MRLPREEFERLVAEAIEGLPNEFAEKLENVEFIVEDHPIAEDYGKRGIGAGRLLLGLYHGVPLTKRSLFGSNLMPDRITIFQWNIERVCRTSEEIVCRIRHTVLHEIAHHFGISEQRIRELGY